jgi:hypothetical protein
MKRLYLVIFLLPLIFSCQSNNLGSYQMSWMGWAFLAAGGIGAVLIFVLKKGVVSDGDGSTAKANEYASDEFKPVGDYIGGHPKFRKPDSGFIFRKNSHCCMSFYSNHSDNPPEFRFKIKVGSFRNISVEDPSSFQRGSLLNHISLPDKTINLLKKKSKDQLALLKIDWTDGESGNTAVFSFQGKDAMEKANKAKENLLEALN